MKVPWDITIIKLRATKHFVLKYMRLWGWDFRELRDAIGGAYRIDKIGKEKYEIYVQKSGYKKIITVYFSDENKLLCISGSQGGKRK